MRLPSHKSKSLPIPSHIHPVGCQTHALLPTAQTIRLSKLILLIILLFSYKLNSSTQEYDSIAIFMQQYEFQKAIDKINIIDKSGSDLRLIDIKATALNGLNKYQEAIPEYENLLKTDTNNLRNIISLANCYQSIGNNKNAQRFYKKALIISTQNNYLYQQLANAYYQDNDFHHAILNYSIVYEVDSSYYLSKQLAKCFDNLEKVDTAIYYYQKAFNLNQSDFQTAYRLANLYKQNQDYKAAIILTESF
ncbi:MAG: hypothetical protein JW723_01600 [Bacteroidales bacterium]|nr:hypothetical protein [Bacteroidales bacterium]